MSRVPFSFLVSVAALLLLSPVIGISNGIVTNESLLLSDEFAIGSRDADYDVEITRSSSNDGINYVTRNEEVTNSFVVNNNGNLDDTYNLTVSWSDSSNYGWFAEPVLKSISVSSGGSEEVSFSFQAPIQGIYSGETCTFAVKATSHNSSSTSSTVNHMLEIIMTYAVDVDIRQDIEQSGNRGDSVTYVVDVTNVGENPEEFSIAIGNVPKDWLASTTFTSISLEPQESSSYDLEVSIPNNAAENEYAAIRTSVHVQTSSYDHVHAYVYSNTSVLDGLQYGVNIVVDEEERQVIPGGEIDYDLSITNTGETVDSYFLELGEAISGWSLDLSTFTVDDLEPNDSRHVILSITGPDNAQEGDLFQAHVKVSSSSREKFNDNLTTKTTIRIPVRDVLLTSSDTAMSGNPGSTVTYSMVIKNTGTDPDDFTLSIDRCEDCGAWSTTLSIINIENLAADSSHNFDLHVTIPVSARDTLSATFGIIATSQSSSDANDRLDTVTTVNTVYDASLIPSVVPILNPEDESSFDIKTINNGNGVQSFKITSDELPSGWGFEDTIPYTTGDLQPYGGDMIKSVPFKVPAGASAGFVNFTVKLFVDKANYEVQMREVMLSIKVENYADFTLDVFESESAKNPGETHEFTVKLINNANADDVINFEVDNLLSQWQSCISETIANSNCVDSITLPKDSEAIFSLRITTNVGDSANTVQGVLVSLIATSSLNEGVSKSDSFKIYTNPTYNLVVTTSDDRKDAKPGEKFSFQIKIINKGNADDFVTVSPPKSSTLSATVSNFDSRLKPEPHIDSELVVFVEGEVPANAFGGENKITLNVTSDHSKQKVDIEFIVFVNEIANIDVEMKTTAGEVVAGTSGTYSIRLTNNGNTIENLSLTMQGKRSSWFTLPVNTVILEPGDWEEITIEVIPPITQPAGEQAATLNVTLSSDISKTIKKDLVVYVLKSNLDVNDEPKEEDETSLPIPDIGIIPVLLSLVIFSRIKRRI